MKITPIIKTRSSQPFASAQNPRLIFTTMADQSKSPFSFGSAANSGAPGGLFGQQNSAPQSQGGLFGSANKSMAASTPSLFGTSNAPGGNSFFGGGTSTAGQSSNVFGGSSGLAGGENKASPFSFGQKPAGGSGGGGPSLFGQVPSSASQQTAVSAPFQNLATPNKPTSSASTGFSNLFQNAASSAAETAATPTSKSAFTLPPIGSTTPAEPPPSSRPGGNNAFSLNLNNQQQEKKSFLPTLSEGSAPNQAPSQTSTAPSQNVTNSGSGLFANIGRAQNNSATQSSAPVAGSNLFGSLGSQTSAAPPGGQTTSSLFAKPAQSSAAEAQKPTFSFSSATSQPSAHDAQKSQTNAPSLFTLGAPSKPPAPTTSTSSINPFGNLGKSNETAPSTATQASGASTSMFSNLGKAQETPSGSAGSATASSQPQASAPANTASVFGNLNQPTSSASTFPSNPATTNNAAQTQSNTGTAASSNLGQSTSGPAPSAQSRLKNKSMDEIITRWASDLAKYQKEFQKQAEKVATWDHLLVENSEKIQKLYGSTLEAERATAEVERQITAVENDQNELESWLAQYEEKVDQMISNSGDSFHGPDLERERTYGVIPATHSIRLTGIADIDLQRSSQLDSMKWVKIWAV